MDADSRVSKLDHPGWVFGGYIIVKRLLLQVTACDTQNESVGHQLEIRVHFATAHLLPDTIGTYFGKGTDTSVFAYVFPKWYSDTHGERCWLELVGLIFLSLKWLPMPICEYVIVCEWVDIQDIRPFQYFDLS